MSAGVDREPPEPPNTSRTSPRTPRTGGIHKGLNHARIVSKHGSLNRRLPPHARRKQEARSLNVKVKQEVRRAGPHFFKAAAEHYEPRITAAADSRGCCAALCTAHGSKHTSGDQCMPLMHRRGMFCTAFPSGALSSPILKGARECVASAPCSEDRKHPRKLGAHAVTPAAVHAGVVCYCTVLSFGAQKKKGVTALLKV
ncbi:uncharacterized protein ISCGN_001058 [Ixodes scapularis]